MHLQGKPVCSFDPEGLIFAAGINSEMVKLYDLRSFDKVRSVFLCERKTIPGLICEVNDFNIHFFIIPLINRVPLQPSSFSMTGHASGQDSNLATMENSFFFLRMAEPFAS